MTQVFYEPFHLRNRVLTKRPIPEWSHFSSHFQGQYSISEMIRKLHFTVTSQGMRSNPCRDFLPADILLSETGWKLA